MKLSGKTAVITGGSRGIGKAIALAFAKEGADIAVMFDRDVESGQKVVDEVEGLGRKGLVIKADVSTKSEVDKAVDEVLEKFGKIDILVNNAGIFKVAPAIEMSEADWNRIIGVNLNGVFFCSQAVARFMTTHGGGKIINISSALAMAPRAMRVGYCTAKSGISMCTKVLAIEWAKHNISVNAIAPGYVETERTKDLISRGVIDADALKRANPMGRLAKPEEIARVAIFLASEDSSYITGETILVDGGSTAYGATQPT